MRLKRWSKPLAFTTLSNAVTIRNNFRWKCPEAAPFYKVETVGFKVSDSDKCRLDSCSSTNFGCESNGVSRGINLPSRTFV